MSKAAQRRNRKAAQARIASMGGDTTRVHKAPISGQELAVYA